MEFEIRPCWKEDWQLSNIATIFKEEFIYGGQKYLRVWFTSCPYHKFPNKQYFTLENEIVIIKLTMRGQNDNMAIISCLLDKLSL